MISFHLIMCVFCDSEGYTNASCCSMRHTVFPCVQRSTLGPVTGIHLLDRMMCAVDATEALSEDKFCNMGETGSLDTTEGSVTDKGLAALECTSQQLAKQAGGAESRIILIPSAEWISCSTRAPSCTTTFVLLCVGRHIATFPIALPPADKGEYLCT